MSGNPFQKASKKQARLRLALVGPSGSGKTFTALRVATGLGGKVALVDTERASASKYADRFSFDSLELEDFNPQKYIDAIKAADSAGYDVLVIDSLSHAWEGKGGALEMVDNAAKRSRTGNSFTAWKEVTPLHHAMVDAILQSKCHVIVTMRSKTEYVLETNDHGKQVPKKVGMAPVQRAGMEYEFDVVGDLDESTLVISKTRCSTLTKAVIKEPGEALGETLKAWLSDGAAPADPLAKVDAMNAEELNRSITTWTEAIRKKPDAKNRPDIEKLIAYAQARLTQLVKAATERLEAERADSERLRREALARDGEPLDGGNYTGD